MTDTPDLQGPDAPIPLDTRRRLQAQLEDEVHLLHEPLSQTDLDRLYARYDHWQETLGDSPEAIALCDALDDFISACIEAGEGGDPTVEQTYMALLLDYPTKSLACSCWIPSTATSPLTSCSGAPSTAPVSIPAKWSSMPWSTTPPP